MLSAACFLPVWWLAFNRFGPIEFSADDLATFVDDEVHRASGWEVPALTSLRKDVDCLLRMYAPSVTGRFDLDDLLDCPFRELAILEPVWDDRKRFRFMLGHKPTLPPAVLTYAALDYLARTDPNARTSTLSRLAQGIGGPGRIFKLTDEALETGLRAFAESQPGVGVRIVSSAGVPQLAISSHPGEAASDALCAYYEGAGRTINRPVRFDQEPIVGLSQLFEAASGTRAPATLAVQGSPS
jgi:hypothetical protein